MAGKKQSSCDLGLVTKQAGLAYTKLNVKLMGAYFDEIWIDLLNADAGDPKALHPIYFKVCTNLVLLEIGATNNHLEDNAVPPIARWLAPTTEGNRGDFARNVGITKPLAGILKQAMIDIIQRYADIMEKTGGQIKAGIEYDRITRTVIRPLFFTISQTSSPMENVLQFNNDTVGQEHLIWINLIAGCFITQVRNSTHWPAICAADDCDIWFMAKPRSKKRKYHSGRCQNRMYMRQRRAGQRS